MKRVQLDEHLNWNAHINNLLPKLARAIGILAKLRHLMDYQALRSIYFALFNSHLSYSIQLWGHIPIETINKVSKLQSKAIKIIHFANFRASIKPLLVQVRIVPLNRELKLKLCLCAFDQIKNHLPKVFNEFCKFMGIDHNHLTKSAGLKLVVERTNTVKYGSYSIKNLVAKHWNELIPKSRSISKSTLKSHLTSFFIYDLAS